jgi:hypothetical protein
MPSPAWLLLFWSGCAATCAAAAAGSLVGGKAARSWSLEPRPVSAALSLAATIAAGMLIYPVIYGVVFETIGRADVPAGAVMGGVHAVLAVAASHRAGLPRTMPRMAVMHLIYGIVLALLYVTP